MTDEQNNVRATQAQPLKEEDSDKPKSGARILWRLKVIGGITTIVVALSGVYFAVYEIVAERRKQGQAEQRTAEAERATALLQLQLKRLELDAERQKSELEVRERRAAIQGDLEQAERIKVSDAISDLFKEGEEGLHLARLAQLAQYYTPTSKYRGEILIALSAKLAQPHSRSETSVAFELLESIGPDALKSVANINRGALVSLQEGLEEQYWQCILSHSVGENLKKQDKGMGDTMYCALRVADEIDFDLRHSTFRILEDTAEDMIRRGSLEDSAKSRARSDPVALRERLSLRAAILEYSKSSLGRLLGQAPKYWEVDLSGTYLAGFVLRPGSYPAIKLADAYIQGASFSQGHLSTGSLVSLGEATIIPSGPGACPEILCKLKSLRREVSERHITLSNAQWLALPQSASSPRN